MQLESISVQHFRSLYDTGWIPFHDLTVLIGENDGGKTATLDVLEILLGSRNPDTEDFSYKSGTVADAQGTVPRETEILIEGRFSLTDPERALVAKIAPLEADLVHLRKQFDFGGGSLTTVLGDVPADPRLRIDIPAANINHLRALAKDLGIQVGGAAKQPYVDAIEAHTAGQSTTQGKVHLPAALGPLLPEFTRFDSASDPQSVVHSVLRTIFKQEIERPENTGPLGEVQKNITIRLQQEADALNPFVQKYRPEVKSVSVDPQFNFESGFRASDLRLQDQNDRPILLEKRGTGVQKHITLAVYEWNSEVLKKRQTQGARPLVLALDEPDTSLDYQSQRKLFETIQSFVSPLVQVVISTHSVNLINRVPIKKLNHYTLDTNKTKSVIESFTPDASNLEETDFFLHRLGDGLGLHHALMFYERCFLLFEGKTEELAIPIIFKLCAGEFPYVKGVRIVNAYDNYGAIVFAKFLHKHKRRVVFAVDEDTTRNKGVARHLTKESLERAGFDIPRQVHFVKPDCFEFAFSDEVWAKALNEHAGDTIWTPAKINVLREPPQAFVGKLMKESGIASKPMLGLALAKSLRERTEVPECIRECIERAIEFAS